MREWRRRTSGLGLWVLALGAAGCGERPDGEAPAPPPPRFAEAAPVSTLSPAALAAEVRALGLDLLTPGRGTVAAGATEASQGPPPRAVADSTLIPDRTRPAALLESAFAALEASDAAALARLSRRGPLDEDAVAAAERRFLGPVTRRYWERVQAAVAAGALRTDVTGAEAVLTVEVGGAAGAYRVRLRREEDGWYLAD